jgi:hypothetical protein
MKDPKTPTQLRQEIQYFIEQIARLTSRDRIRRCRVAIRRRKRQLVEALRVRQVL